MGHHYDTDVLAPRLADWANMARKMPPSFQGAAVRQPMYGPYGDYIGHMMPGKGLYLGRDLKDLKITKDIPGIYEYTLFNRIRDKLNDWDQDERGAITTYDGIIAGRAGGKAQDWTVAKQSHTTATNTWHSVMGQAGIPGPVTYPATTAPTDAIPDRATAGYFGLIGSNTSGAEKKYLLTLGWSSAQTINMMMLYDALIHAGAFRVTVTSAETIAAEDTITRQYTSPLGAGACIIFIATTAVTATPTGTFTVRYTNEAGTASRDVVLNITVTTDTAIIHRLFPVPSTGAVTSLGHCIPLLAPDYGVRALKQTTTSVAMTGGPVTGLIYQPLMWVPGIVSDTYIERDSTAQIDGLTELIQVSNVWGALGVFILAAGTTSGQQRYFFRTVAG